MLFGAGFVIPNMPGGAVAPKLAWPNGYRYRQRAALSGDLHGMPDGGEGWVFWRTASAVLKSVANSGHVQNGAFLDSRWETISGQPIKAEMESYDPVVGEITAWLRLTNFRAGQDYHVLHHYGKADVAAREDDPAGCWAGFSIVSRLSDGSDQSGLGHNLVLTGVTPTTLLEAVAGDFA